MPVRVSPVQLVKFFSLHAGSLRRLPWCIPVLVPVRASPVPSARVPRTWPKRGIGEEDRVHTCTSRILEGRSGAQVGLSCSWDTTGSQRGARWNPNSTGGLISVYPVPSERKKTDNPGCAVNDCTPSAPSAPKRGIGRRTGSPPARAGFWKDDQGDRWALLLLTRDTTGSQRGARWNPNSATGGLISV